MNKLFGILAALLMASSAHAYTENYDKGHSTYTTYGVWCSSGATPANITSAVAVPGFNIAAYRISNQSATAAVYIGHSTIVSTTSVSAAQLALLGERLVPGANGTWPINRGADAGSSPLAGTRVQIYCRADDVAGALLSIGVFGYR